MSSMSPVIVTDSSGNVIFIAGGSGGSRIISSVSQVAIYNLWLGKSIRDAVDMPRLHQQLIPMEVELEKRFPVVSKYSLDNTVRLVVVIETNISFLERGSWTFSERPYDIQFSWWLRCSSN